jgi:hypothetical protein
MLDASIAAWNAKRRWDYVRPITAVRTRRAGQWVLAWGGPYRGTRLIRGESYLPYQPMTSLAPPFPEYVSGHSTFSAAGAQVLRMFTGSDLFGAQVTIPAGSSRIEPGATPAVPMVLAWPTFTNALDEAGNSRRQAASTSSTPTWAAATWATRSGPTPGPRRKPTSTARLGNPTGPRAVPRWCPLPTGGHQHHAARWLGAFCAVDPSPSCQPKPANYVRVDSALGTAMMQAGPGRRSDPG